ncbi:MAG: glycosyltransferase [Eubacterium sp.]|nr:glycosyltransferase [Eubacterium sp.]
MKRCIFYLPYKLPEHCITPGQLRPKKMVQAFRDIGYDVFVIWGYCEERKELIKELKSNIKNGYQYEFMYTESSSIPTLLTEPHHYPTHPFMDFSFFRYIKRQGIKIGLFYRDIHWKFDIFKPSTYRKQLAALKNYIYLTLYKYDIRQYKRLIDRFYLPSLTMADIIGSKKLKNISALLLPGSDNLSVKHKDYSQRDFTKKPLNIFYVGNISEHYHLIEILKAVSRTDHCSMTLCCHEKLWLKEKEKFEPYLNENIHIIHKSSNELEPYYKEADIGSIFFENNDYMDMAIPFKSFEYLANEIPAIATTNTAIGKFIETNGNGWTIPYNTDAACELLNRIIKNPELISEKQCNCIKVKQENLWIARAKKVEQDLCC